MDKDTRETVKRVETRDYVLQLTLDNAALRAEVQRLRQAMKETVRHE